MIEVFPALYVGDQEDEASLRERGAWFIVHACKDPHHRQALGYSGRAAPKDHPEYLLARREGRLILNLVDVADVAYISPIIIDAALEAIHGNIGSKRVLVHCNQGQSRSPTIAFLYLAKHTDLFAGLDFEGSLSAFRALYPTYSPAKGVADYASLNWAQYHRAVK